MRSSQHQPFPHARSATATAAGDPDLSENLSSDETLLDRFFDDAIWAIQNGSKVSLDGMLRGNEHLTPEFERLCDLARFVAPQAAEDCPKIEGYTVLSELGRGGMATVYLARQERLGGRVVALKVLPRQEALSPRAKERFRSETLAIARQKHSGVVPVYDVIDDGSTLAFAMEWVDGRTLDEVISRVRQELAGNLPNKSADRRALAIVNDFTESSAASGAVPADDSYCSLVARIVMTVARALHAVHQTGILHRDIKPSNILLRKDRTVLLSDFGLARELDGVMATSGESFLGTAPYSAPEQLRGRRDLLDARSDVYSLGATLYHALALQAPFSSRSPVEVMAQVESSGPKSLRVVSPAVSNDLCVIMAKAMEPEPGLRYKTAAAMADDLQRFLDCRPILARPASLIARARKFGRRNRVMLATGIVVAASVALAAGLVVRHQFYNPRWAQEALTEARMVLLTRAHGFEMYNHSFFGSKTPTVWPGSVERLAHAADTYDRALWFDSRLSQARVERDALREIIRRWGLRSAVNDGAFSSHYPLAAEYLAAEDQHEHAQQSRRMNENDVLLRDVSQMSTDDLRALGLEALTLMDTSMAVESWRELERRVDDDPFIAAALGMLYVCDERYPMAYPRMRDAVRAYPRSGMFRQFAAEAAWGCGDYIRASQYLETARSLPEQDDRSDYRVRMLLRIGGGDFEGAIARYLQDMAGPMRFAADNSILQYQIGREYERRGDLHMAARYYAFGTGGDHWVARRASRFLLSAARRWWGSLDENGQREALATIFDSAGWWDRGASGYLFTAYLDAGDWWPITPSVKEARAAEHLIAVCLRVREDCGTHFERLAVGGNDADRKAMVDWWMTGEHRPAGMLTSSR